MHVDSTHTLKQHNAISYYDGHVWHVHCVCESVLKKTDRFSHWRSIQFHGGRGMRVKTSCFRLETVGFILIIV